MVSNKADVVESVLLQEGEFNENLCLAGRFYSSQTDHGKNTLLQKPHKKPLPSLGKLTRKRELMNFNKKNGGK